MWINKETAKELGMTHEGTQFGVAVYLRLNDDNEFYSIPKFIPHSLWLWVCDGLYEMATWFMSEDTYLETPMTIGNEI